MRVIVAAGGTGGHIFPGLAVAEAVLDAVPDSEVMFIGTGKELEQKIVSSRGFEIKQLPSQAISGKGIKGLFSLLLLLPKALFAARSIYKSFKPDVVVGFGGYPSFVPLLAAKLLGIKRVLHEQNVKVGLANRVLSLIANRIFAVQGANGFWAKKNISEVGNPVGKNFYDCQEYIAPREGQEMRVLVFGGSQGAMAINDAIVELSEWFSEHGISLVHQTGSRDYERIVKKYNELDYKPDRVCAFIDDMQEEYNRAHVVICRAGAMSVAELSACGRPAIYVPLELAGSHQSVNVESLCQAGGAAVIKQSEGIARNLKDKLTKFRAQPELLSQMSTAAKNFHLQSGNRPADAVAKGLVELATVKN